MSFEKRLKDYRILKGLKQQEVAEALNKKNNTISDWENGKAKPDVELLPKLCKLYGINPDLLFEEFDDQEKTTLLKDMVSLKIK